MRDIEQPGGSVDHAPAVSILCDSGSLDKVAASVFGDGRGSNASGLSRPSREKPTNSERLRYSPVKGRDAETRNNFRITGECCAEAVYQVLPLVPPGRSIATSRGDTVTCVH